MPKFYAVFEGELEREVGATPYSSLKNTLHNLKTDSDIIGNLEDKEENVILILQVVKRVNMQRDIKITEIELEETEHKETEE